MWALHDRAKRLHAGLSRIRQVGYSQYNTECKIFIKFLQTDQYTRSLTEELDAKTNLDYFVWKFDLEPGRIVLPDSEEGRAKVCYGILNDCVHRDSVNAYLEWGRLFGRHGTSEQVLLEFTEGVIRPLVDYLCDKIEVGGNMLHLIRRFKFKCEWFRQKELFNLYQGNLSEGEALLTLELRESLFDGGVNFSFSQPNSPSGEADVAALIEARESLVLEAKVFDPSTNKRQINLHHGFHQALRYAHDYNQNVGFLFVFNCSEKELVITPDPGTDVEHPDCISVGDKNIFVVVANINPNRPTASKEDPSTRETVFHGALLNP